MFADTETKMPVLFIGHGSPMNAIENNPYSRAWIEVGKSLPEPSAILCISAHWETSGVKVTAMDRPETIHDFGGFPQELFQYQYPAPGSPDLARLVQRTIQIAPVTLDESWGLDHGTWSVLCRLFPGAGIPVIQLSLDQSQPPEFHYALGKELISLRKKGILIVGSGNIVHNLKMAFFQVEGYDWAIEFDDQIRRLILSGEHDPMIHYDSLGPASRLAIPTNEHYLPLLYALALQEEGEQVQFFAEQVAYGSLSMRSFKIG